MQTFGTIQRRLAAVALGVTMVALAACGSSTPSSNSPTTSSSSGKSDFVIGSVSDVTGAEASSEGTTLKSLQAWADWTNANGGINGHKVKLITMDTGFNPSTALSEVKQLVQQDHIIALVGEQTSFDSTFASYLQQQGIPAVGSGTFENASWQNPDWFPQGTTIIPEQYNMIHLGVAKGYTKWADLYCAEAPACAQSVPLNQALSKMMNVNLVYTAAVSATAPDYTAPCVAAKNAGAQYMGIGDNSATILRVAASCKQQGYTPMQVGTDGTVTNSWATASAMQGARMVQQDAPFSDTSNPGVKTMIAALNKYEPGVTTSESWGENDVFSWTSGLLFTAAAKAANLGNNATSAQVIKGLYDLHNETLGGMAPPLTFTNNGKGHQVYCSFVQGVENNKFTMPQGSKLNCAPKSLVDPIISAAGG